MEYTDNTNHANDMTLEEQIGQILMIGFWGLTPPQEVITLIERYHVGNIILFSRNIQEAEQVFALTRQLWEAAVRFLFGECQAHGKLPVNIPELYP